MDNPIKMDLTFSLRLEKPSEKLLCSYLDFIEEMRSCGEKIWDEFLPKDGQSEQNFLTGLLRAETVPEPPRVAETTYWASSENQVVGRISLRHYLNDALKEFGGHIGYEVRPSSRNRGIAKEMLKQLLQTPKARDVKRLLLTCAPDNIASIKTIVANGGILAKTAYVEKWQRSTNYYWIDL